MRWVVFGGTGRLGSHLRDRGGEKFVRLGSADLDLSVVSASKIVAKVRDLGGEGIVNCAAYTSVPAAERNSDEAAVLNWLAVEKIAIASEILGIPLVHVSTDYVFGGREGPYRPRDVPCPINHYGRSKALGETAVRERGGCVARVSFAPDPPGYTWVADGALVTKEWVDESAERLVRFLASGDWSTSKVVHLVPETSTTLVDFVHSRHPTIPVVTREVAETRLPYPFPWDCRLSEAWSPDA